MIVHSGFASGGINIAEETTGAIQGGTYLNDNGEAITLDDVSDIYMVIQWWDINKGEDVTETIDLYTKKQNGQSFLY